MMRELPSFADLMLLPALVEREAIVFIKGDHIAVETVSPTKVVRVLGVYPHVRPRVDGDGDVVLEAQEAHHRRLLLVWPSGRSQGVLVWERGYFSVLPSAVMTALVAAGCAVDTVDCAAEESLHGVLARLAPVEPYTSSHA